MRPKVKKVLGVSVGVLALLAVALVARAKWVIERSYAQVAEPAIVADTSPEGVARGELLVQSLCVECHAGADGRATGKHLQEVPVFLGTFYSANLAHPEHGVHARTDGQIARVLRTGVLPDGRLSVLMGGFTSIGDDDVAAILGYMRSKPRVFEPGGADQPRSEPSLVGKLIVTYVAGVKVAEVPPRVVTPKKAPSVEYGRYMAQVLDCVGCHTDGFAADKMNDEAAFAGGFELTDPTGAPIYTRNITFDEETGIGRWSVDDFQRAVTRGVHPDGHVVRKPMPLFSRLDRTDVEALYAFLKSRPPVKRVNKAGGQPVRRAREGDEPEVMFVELGCAACHGESGPYRDKLRGALGKSDAELASWILDPQATKPGSPMPSFAGVVDRTQAEALGRYAKDLAAKSSQLSQAP